MHKNKQNQAAYVAISSVLVIAAVALILITSATLIAISEMQQSFSHEEAETSLQLSEGCAQAALLELNLNNALPTTISLPSTTCNISLISQDGDTWTFTASSDNQQYPKQVTVTASRTDKVNVLNWHESQ
jgi:hypothetical protein